MSEVALAPPMFGSARRNVATLVACCLATFLVPLDITVVGVALDPIAHATGAGLEILQWILDGYALAFTATLLAGGALADRYGRRRMLLIGAAAFGASSLLCGLAANPLLLVACRIIQGATGALLLTAAMGVLTHAFAGPARPRAFAIWGVVVGAGFAFGPLIGGGVLSASGWQAIFLLNLPLLALVLLLVAHQVEESGDETARALDLPGLILSAIVLFAGTFALLRSPAAGLSSKETVLSLAVALACLLAFVAVERRARAPMLDPELLADRRFLASVAVSLLSGASYYAVLVFLPLHFQAVGHQSASAAGLSLMPMTLPILFGAPLGGLLVQRVRLDRFLGVGMAGVGLGLLGLGVVGPGAGWPASALLLGIGLSNGIINAQLTAAVIGAAPAGRAGFASAVASMSRHAGFALGTALLGLVVSLDIGARLTSAGAVVPPQTVARIAAGRFDMAPPDLAGLVVPAFDAALGDGILIAGVLALGAAVVALACLRRP